MKVPKSIRSLHSDLEETASLVEKEVRELLFDYCASKKWIFNCRCKEKISFAQKLETGIYSSKEAIDDFFACEIIVPNLQEIEIAKEYVSNSFNLIYERPDQQKPASEFSFDGIRMYVQVKPGVAGKSYSWMTFEVQIKTLLEKAWGEATHDFTYKCKDIQWAKERLVFQMKALLSHADIVLSDVEEMSKRPFLYREYDKYSELNEISKWITDNWDDTECPKNMKRLSETVYKLTKQYKVPFKEIRSIVKSYQKDNGGVKNLSVYATIIQALFSSSNSQFLEKAKSKYNSKSNELKLIIPEEINIENSIKDSLNEDRCIFLSKFQD